MNEHFRVSINPKKGANRYNNMIHKKCVVLRQHDCEQKGEAGMIYSEDVSQKYSVLVLN